MKNMHEQHDPDLIAAYAEGDFGGDAGAAEELVSSCAECRMEFEAQREIRTILQAAPAVAMTESEREAVHHAVHAGIAEPAPVIILESRRRSLRRWMAVGAVAAMTVTVVGIAGVLTGGDDAGTDSVAMESADDTAAASGLVGEERMAVQSSEAASATTAAMADEEADGAAAADAMTDTTVAGPAGPFLAYMDAGAISRVELEERVSSLLTTLQAGTDAEELTVDWFNTNDMPAPECLSAIEDPLYAVINAEVATQRLQVLVVRDTETGVYSAVTFALPGCDPA